MINRKTKIILYNLETEYYEIGTLEDSTSDHMPVCSVAHFFNTICKMFEEITPNLGKNPLYQNIDWSEVWEAEYDD